MRFGGGIMPCDFGCEVKPLMSGCFAASLLLASLFCVLSAAPAGAVASPSAGAVGADSASAASISIASSVMLTI